MGRLKSPRSGGKCLVESDADCAGVGLDPLTVPGEHRDRILVWLRQRILPGGLQIEEAAVRTIPVGLGVQGPVPAAEYQRPEIRWCVEVADAPVAGAQTVGSDGVVLLQLREPVRKDSRAVVAAVQRFGRRHRPRGQGGGVSEGAVGALTQREHVPDFGGSVVALV
jgi:hypothetical protein